MAFRDVGAGDEEVDVKVGLCYLCRECNGVLWLLCLCSVVTKMCRF